MMIPKPTRFTKIVRKMIERGRTELMSADCRLERMIWDWLFHDAHALDYDRIDRYILHIDCRFRRHIGNAIDDVHAGEHAAEDGIPELVWSITSVVQHAIVHEVDVEL